MNKKVNVVNVSFKDRIPPVRVQLYSLHMIPIMFTHTSGNIQLDLRKRKKERKKLVW